MIVVPKNITISVESLGQASMDTKHIANHTLWKKPWKKTIKLRWLVDEL